MKNSTKENIKSDSVSLIRRNRKKAAAWVAALSVTCGLIAWHVIHWHATGKHAEMFRWIETDRGYITVAYNLGLMLFLGILLGLLMMKITDLLGYKVRETKHYDRESDTGKR